MAEDRAALLDEADRRGLLPPDMKSAYDEAKKRDLIKPPGMLERLGTGFMDPIYGAAQIGARMTEEGFSASPEADVAAREQRIQTVDTAVKEREKGIQAARPQAERGSTDWLRVGGSIPSTIALTAPTLAVGGVAGAALGGAAGAALQPTTDTENFGTEKAKSAAEGGVAGGVFGAGAKALGAGVRALGTYLAREYPENVMTQAVQKVLKRMGQDEAAGGPSAQQAIDLINEADRAGKPMTLADVGGENTRALAGNVTRQPESRAIGQQFLNQRDEAAAQRLNADIKKYVHGGDSMFKTTQALVEARSAASRPAYEIAMDPAKIVDSPRLRSFLNDPTVRQGIPAGLESQRLEALAAGEKFNPNAAQYFAMDEAGNITGVKGVPNMRTLDAVKRGMDAQIEAEIDPVTGRMSQRGTMLNRVRAEFVRELDALNPDYAAARAAWGGPSAAMSAMSAGKAAFRSSPEQIAAEIADLTPADREFYRLGVADAIRERLMKTGISGDDAKAIIKNPWMRDQLKPIFRTPQDFDAFVNSVTAESRMFGTRQKVLGGSQTAERLAEDTSSENAMSAHGMHLAEQTATGHWLSAAKTAVRMWRDRQDRAGNPKLNEQVARILFQTPIDPAGEVGQRLTGQFTGPQGVNRLAPAATGIEETARVLAPGSGSALSQPTQ